MEAFTEHGKQRAGHCCAAYAPQMVGIHSSSCEFGATCHIMRMTSVSWSRWLAVRGSSWSRWVRRRTAASTSTRYTSVAVELPTLALLVANDVVIAALVVAHPSIPLPLLVVAFAVCGAMHMSLQHEALHGHPTPHQWLNELLVTVPSFIWLSFPAYRDSHRLHHRVELTHPQADPESFYVDQETWDRSSRLWRAVLEANRTLLGRMVLWPVVAMARGTWSLLRDAVRTRRGLLALAGHALATWATLWLVTVVGGVPWWVFATGFIYGGLALTCLRSFAEHLAVADGVPSAMVRTNWFWSTLFLNNNLHHAHHAAPNVAWYRLPQTAEILHSDQLAAAGAGLYLGYREVARRHLVHPFSQPIHPFR